ncbi:glycoside hydrolase family 6 protein [Paenibacillus lentus]|uniref:glycoside hydrolase family 6 protein n=1 Tax=Paenibacillus lentus TaxID=1338368 RepID=UPI0036654D62
MIKYLPKRTAVFALISALVVTMFTPFGDQNARAAEAHVDNPYVGATKYINPDYATLIDSSIAQVSDATLKAKMETVKSYNTYVWLDRIAAIYGGENNGNRRSLEGHLDAALAQKQGNTPIVAEFVIYDLPGRDCHALASNGELPLTQAGLQTYKTDYIDVIADIFSNPKYQDIRIVTVVEPDSLPNLVTNLSNPACAAANSSGIYVDAIKYTLNKLAVIPNVYTYVDIGHSGWLGWDDNRQGAVQLYTQVAQATDAGFASIDGFALNTANTTPLVEPNLPDPNRNVNGMPLRSADFYEWNPYFSEADFAAGLYSGFVSAGWPSSIGFIIDTSRNGWGGPDRPTSAIGSTINEIVDSGRVDRRQHRGLWCNNSGAGMGRAPETAPSGFAASHIDAFVWVKPPGESDGSSSEIPNNEGKGFDRMCDPTYQTQFGILTGALPNAPVSGHWFHDQFVMLVENAYPAVPASNGGGPVDPPPTAPGAPTGVSATAGDGQISLSWNASQGATSYTVKRSMTSGGPYTTLATISGTSYTDTAVTNGTTYYYVVSAANSVGSSPNSTQASALPEGGSTPNPEPTGDLVVQYKAGDTNATDNQFKPHFNIVNNGSTPVALSELTLRYYFTAEDNQSLQFNCDWAMVGCTNLTGSFVKMSQIETGADSYLEIKFNASAGTLAPGGSTGDIQTRNHSSNWTNLNESNDYSYDPTKTSYANWEKVTLHQNGTLVWGIEP